MTIKDISEIVKQLEKLGDIEKIAMSADVYPEFDAIGRHFKVGVKKDFCCMLTADEIKKKVNKICVTKNLKSFYILAPEYYLKFKDVNKYEFIGEFSSKLKDSDMIVDFGFGTPEANLVKFDLI